MSHSTKGDFEDALPSQSLDRLLTKLTRQSSRDVRNDPLSSLQSQLFRAGQDFPPSPKSLLGAYSIRFAGSDIRSRAAL